MSSNTPNDSLLNQLKVSLADGSFVRLQLTKPVNAGSPVKRVEARLIDSKKGAQLSVTTREQKRDVTTNFPLQKGVEWIGEQVGKAFRNALLRTTVRDWQLHFTKKGDAKLVGHKPSSTTIPSRQHDQSKHTLLNETANDWLQALNILDGNARLRASMADKHRQINHYTEILSHLAKDCGWSQSEGRVPRAPNTLKVADMGCGKGYLTFAAWHLFHRILKRPIKMLGVETRTELVDAANNAVRQIDAEGLEFIAGDIASTKLPQLDVLIALHACNTATDEAIRRGIELNAKLIVVAPCCHQALRPAMGDPKPFAPLLQHGLFKERMAEWLTDGLRTLFLEWAGYQTKVIEFVASEHTPKNLMITAVRESNPFKNEEVKQRIIEIKQFFNIEKHALDPLLEP